MGINKSAGMFISVSKGWLQYGKKDSEGKRQTCRSITGFIRNISVEEDEYEKKKREVVVVHVEDPDAATPEEKKMQLKFTLLSWYGQGFGSRMKRIDFTKPVTIGASGADGGNEKVSFCWMKQDGKPIEADKENWPKPNKVMVNGQEMTDWGPMSKHFKEALNELKSQAPDDDLPF